MAESLSNDWNLPQWPEGTERRSGGKPVEMRGERFTSMAEELSDAAVESLSKCEGEIYPQWLEGTERRSGGKPVETHGTVVSMA